MTDNKNLENFICPLPLPKNKEINIGHGSGGSLTKSLIDSVFYKHFSNPILDKGNDFANLSVEIIPGGFKIVTATDAHVINPIFFPGGDIGRLAIAGTVNDVSMSGGIPKYLTATFIIEEGFPIIDLEKIAISMKACADEAEVQIVAGDTKVVEKGKADKVFITTAGIGFVNKELSISGAAAQPGDSVIITGTIGDHGIAVLAARNELGFSTTLKSDVAPLNHLIQSAIKVSPHIHVLRDPTRGGVATTLNEIAIQSNVKIVLQETALPIRQQVRGACDILGFDPLYIANEGKVLIITPQKEESELIKTLHKHPLGINAKKIGHVEEAKSSHPVVIMKTIIGGTRIVDMLTGTMLPRIC
ncbi:MAG: hydrogenase expression/formation protein HypE [Anaerolineaceae bacterium]|nr:hydrogenase expression/formation protein HypE [Anaerolineaceae bacterium]